MTIELRASFDGDAELYDIARPRYPEALFDELEALAGLPREARVLEIGCGTGQATLPMARRGHHVTCVELGPHLAAVARDRLRDHPNVRVEVSAFEDWTLPAGGFDLVLAATSWHWQDPMVRFRKAAAALRPAGALAVIGAEHGSDGRGDAFFTRAQELYERCSAEIGETLEPWSGLPAASAVQPPEVDGTLFQLAGWQTFPWTAEYTAAGYLAVLNTYSGHRTRPASWRDCLYSGLVRLIDGEFGGRIEKRYLFTLAVARLRQPRL